MLNVNERVRRVRDWGWEECEEEEEVKEQRGWLMQTHRCLGQTQNAAVLNVQTVLQHTNKQTHKLKLVFQTVEN